MLGASVAKRSLLHRTVQTIGARIRIVSAQRNAPLLSTSCNSWSSSDPVDSRWRRSRRPLTKGLLDSSGTLQQRAIAGYAARLRRTESAAEVGGSRRPIAHSRGRWLDSALETEQAVDAKVFSNPVVELTGSQRILERRTSLHDWERRYRLSVSRIISACRHLRRVPLRDRLVGPVGWCTRGVPR